MEENRLIPDLVVDSKKPISEWSESSCCVLP